MPELEKDMISIKDYAESKGVTYEAVRSQIKRYENEPELKDHIHKFGKTRFLEPEAVRFLDQKRNSNPVVVVTGEKDGKIEQLELKIKELKEDRDRQRDEKELYMKELLELRTKGIDTTKYIAIEDHQKTEEQLKEKEEEIEKLKTENETAETEIGKLKSINEQLKEDSVQLRTVTLKVSKLNSEIEEKMNTLNGKETEIIELQKKNIAIEEEKKKAEEEKRKAEEEREKAEAERIKAEEEMKQKEKESLENLSLGFFARRKKLKELKQKGLI